MALYGGKSSALDCSSITTKCTEPGGHAECAYGAECFDAGLCDGGKGFCSSEDEFDCENISTYCDHPGETGQCPHGQKCYDTEVCTPKEVEVEEKLNEVCFSEGKIVDCSSWGDDGYGEAVSVPFTYTVNTDGKIQPEEVITPMENAILEDVAEQIEADDKYADFSGEISAAPEDSIAGE
jgi:hypothetical protein